jgi:pyruvate kinase
MPCTKIVATLGPATEEKSEIKSLVEAGMNIARLNFSHGTEAQFKKIVANIHTVEKETGRTIVIMQDLQGPKIRLGQLPAEGIRVKKGEVLTFATGKLVKGAIPLPYAALPKVVKPGHALLIEDGLIRTKILSIKGALVKAKVLVGGVLKSHKGVNIPDSKLPSSEALNAKDKKDLAFGIKTLRVDAVAISFVETAEDIMRVRSTIARMTKRPTFVVAKIERPKALLNLREIIEAADGIMVARGDLGIEIEAERVPVEQKRILALCRQEGKPVIIATQILQSMIDNPLPTRAEMSDAATAIFDHADAFMLSNETAVGKYPNKAVQTLTRVAEVTEKAIFENVELFPAPPSPNPKLVEDEVVALNACVLADEIDAAALVILTHHGFTARTVLKHRPKNRIIVVTPYEEVARQLHFLWGVENVYHHTGPFRSEEIIKELRAQKVLKKGQQVVSIKLSDEKRSLVMMTV